MAKTRPRQRLTGRGRTEIRRKDPQWITIEGRGTVRDPDQVFQAEARRKITVSPVEGGPDDIGGPTLSSLGQAADLAVDAGATKPKEAKTWIAGNCPGWTLDGTGLRDPDGTERNAEQIRGAIRRAKARATGRQRKK